MTTLWSSSGSDFSVTLMANFAKVFAKSGGNPEELHLLSQNKKGVGDLVNVLKGLARIIPIDHTINCDAEPNIPAGLKLKSHRKQGFFEWRPEKVEFQPPTCELGVLPTPSHEFHMTVDEILKELDKKPFLNANVLDYLLAHTILIPREWEHVSRIFFWGTIYIETRDAKEEMVVRYLDHCVGWREGYAYLSESWNSLGPAALLAA